WRRTVTGPPRDGCSQPSQQLTKLRLTARPSRLPRRGTSLPSRGSDSSAPAVAQVGVAELADRLLVAPPGERVWVTIASSHPPFLVRGSSQISPAGSA